MGGFRVKVSGCLRLGVCVCVCDEASGFMR